MKIVSSARSSLLFLFGLSLAAGLALADDTTWRLLVGNGGRISTEEVPDLAVRSPRKLNEEDLLAASKAWAFFDANTHKETGLVDSVTGFPSTTLWDQASYFLALTAAHRLELISESEFESRATKALTALETIELVKGILPNKVYNTQTLEMVDYANNPVPDGIGWSALDISRFLVSMRVLEDALPDLQPLVRNVVARWDLTALTANGEIIGAFMEEGALVKVQEGRIGYEQYAARVLLLWGVDASMAVRADRIADWETVQDVEIAIDRRQADNYGAIDAVLSEPYMLQGLELGFDQESAMLSARVYAAQEARFTETGIPTMVSEDHLDQAPFFLYSSVFSKGGSWTVLSDTGEFYPDLRTISTKAVFAWDALYQTPYTHNLRRMLEKKMSAEKLGWPAGIFETDETLNTVLTTNTNAVVLEALHFKAFGPMLHYLPPRKTSNASSSFKDLMSYFSR